MPPRSTRSTAATATATATPLEQELLLSHLQRIQASAERLQASHTALLQHNQLVVQV